MSAPAETPTAPAPFGTNVGEAPGADFLTAMQKAMGLPSDNPATEEPKAAAAPAKAADKPAAQPASAAAAEDSDIPPEIKSEKARDGWKEVKRNLAAARKEADEWKAKVSDYEKKLAERTAPQVPEDIQRRLADLEKEREDLSERLRVADVERHPKFQQYFEGKTKALTEAAKGIVGQDHAAQLERILKVSDSELRTQQLDELMGELTPARAARLGAVVADIELLQQEKAAEISKAKERWGQLQQATEAEKAAQFRQREELAERLVSAATEMEAFKAGEGADAARVAEINTYKGFVKQALTGRLEGPDEQFMPLMAVEGLHLKTKVLPTLQAKLADLEKRLAEYESAKPKPPGSGGGDAGSTQPKSFLDIMSGRA